MSDDNELPEGYTWDMLRAKADQTNAWRADMARKGHPVPGADVDAEYLARCYREEQTWEASQAAKWDALTPIEQEASKALEDVANEEIETILEIIAAAMSRRGIRPFAPSRELIKVMAPTDPDYAEVTAAFARIDVLGTMLEDEESS